MTELEAQGCEVVVHEVEYPVRARAGSADGRPEGAYISEGWTEAKERAARILYGRHAPAILDCRPAPDTGHVWLRDYFVNRYEVTPVEQARMCDRTALVIDGAATHGGGDHTSIDWWGWIGARSYLLGTWRGQWGYPVLRQTVLDVYAQVRPDAVVVEDASSGRQIVQEMERTFRGIEKVTARGRKRLRWEAVHPQHRAGQVFYPRSLDAPWMGERIARLLVLTGEGEGEVDDEADTEALALTWRAEGAPRVVRRSRGISGV